MKKVLFLIVLLFLFASVAIAGCGKNGKAEQAKVVESFYSALVNQQRDQVNSLVCKDWEKQGLREVDAFMGVKAEMKNFACLVKSADKEKAEVTCTGAIAASYGAEVTEFPVDDRQYTVVKENGDWRLCGY